MAARSADAGRVDAVFLGRYEILGKLGEGGFGSVYKARQLTTGQTVAIKVLRIPEGHPQAQIDRLMVRFQREMRLCAELHHPNIVRLIDSGHADSRLIYSIFEFIPGQDLALVLEAERRLSSVETRYLMMQVLDALACAHEQGVVHRDLKPENIMVVPTGARRNAVILDFGIGALTADARREEARLTMTSEWVGTPIYAAPELLRGARPTPRADLYSWGLVFLECLTGETPVQGAGVAAVVYNQLSPDPVPIPTAIAQHPLGRILRRATEKEPEARDVTAEGLMRELEACDVSNLVLNFDRGSTLSAASVEALLEARGKQSRARLESGRPPGRASVLPAAEVPSVPPRSAPPRSMEGERRQVTIVCCALSVASAATAGADIEELDQILAAEQEACTAIARRFGGHVGGVLSDTMLFFFGYPTAREDDARRAARAALSMVAEVRGRSATTAAKYGGSVDLRIGMHTGMMITRGPDTPAGHLGGATPQAATKLSSIAQPGEILASSDTHRLLRSHFVFGDPPATGDVASQRGPYRLLREGSADPDVEEIPLIGRQRELDALMERWNRVRSGMGQAVLITGEPGVGKSRLTRALQEHIRTESHMFVEGRCSPDAINTPLYPIVDVLDRLIDPSRELWSGAKAERLALLLSRFGFDLEEGMPLFAPLLSIPLPPRFSSLDLSPQKQREKTCNALLSLFFEMGERAPLMLLIEDLQWADPSTLEFCSDLVAEVASGRVFALFTGRPEFSPPWSPLAALTIPIGNLDREGIEQMAAAVTGGRALPKEVVERIAARSDGVPLFVEEFVLTMLESGALVVRDEELVLTGDIDDLGIPSTLRDLLTARLDRLGRAKETAQVAAVIGREFSFDLLRAVVPVEESALGEDLDKLVTADLVHRKRRLRNPNYLYKHALIQDTAYDSMLKARRREAHERVARALLKHFPDVAEEQPEILARHLEQAGLIEESVGYLLQAGQRALGRGAHTEAIASLRRGIDLLSTLPHGLSRFQREIEIRAVLGGALVTVKGYCAPDVTENLVRALALCDEFDDPPSMFPVLYGLWVTNLAASNRAPTEAHANQLIDFVRSHPDRAREVTAHFAFGSTELYRGRFEQGRAALSTAISAYDVDLHTLLVRVFGDDHGLYALVYRAWIEVFTGQPTQARASMDASWRLASRLRNPLATTMASVFSMIIYRDLRDVERTAEYADRTIQIATEQAFPFWRSLALCGRGWVRSMRDDHDGGIADIKEGLSFFDLIQQKLPRTYWNAYLIEAYLRAGSRDEGRRVADESLADSATNVDSFNEPELLRLKGDLIAVRPGQHEAALPYYEMAVAAARESGAIYYELRAAISLARASVAVGGSVAAAAEKVEQARAKMREGHDIPVYVEATELLSELAGKA